jgi:hypothetical protein
MNQSRPTTTSAAHVEHARVPDIRESMLLRRHVTLEAVQYAKEHRPLEPNGAAELTRSQTELTMPTEPRLSPDDARQVVEQAFNDPIDPETQQYHQPDSVPTTETSILKDEDNLRDHRVYIDSLFDQDEKKRDDYELIS